MIRVCLAGSQPILLAGLTALLEKVPQTSVVGAATSGATATTFVEAFAPDIVLVDATLSDMTGLTLTRQLQTLAVPTRVIIFSPWETAHHVRLAFAAGARGYVLKRSAVDHLGLAVHAVHGSGTYVDPAVAAPFWSAGGAGPASELPTLTQREAEVLRAVAFGFSIKETAAQLGITPKSVETYKTRACDKLALGSRARIVRYALNQGWFADEAGPCAPDAFVTAPPVQVWSARP